MVCVLLHRLRFTTTKVRNNFETSKFGWVKSENDISLYQYIIISFGDSIIEKNSISYLLYILYYNIIYIIKLNLKKSSLIKFANDIVIK